MLLVDYQISELRANVQCFAWGELLDDNQISELQAKLQWPLHVKTSSVLP